MSGEYVRSCTDRQERHNECWRCAGKDKDMQALRETLFERDRLLALSHIQNEELERILYAAELEILSLEEKLGECNEQF